MTSGIWDLLSNSITLPVSETVSHVGRGKFGALQHITGSKELTHGEIIIATGVLCYNEEDKIRFQSDLACVLCLMHILSIRSFAAIFCVAAVPVLAIAQQPPQLEPLEEGEPPVHTIRKENEGTRITEQREGRSATEIQVKSGNSTYYVTTEEQPGNVQRGDVQSHLTRPPQWRIMEFSLSSSKPAPEAESLAPPLPAPADASASPNQ